jgi:hypothetical protein
MTMTTDSRLITALACADALDDPDLDTAAIAEIAEHSHHVMRGVYPFPSGQDDTLAWLTNATICRCEQRLGVDVGDEWWRVCGDKEWNIAREAAERLVARSSGDLI